MQASSTPGQTTTFTVGGYNPNVSTLNDTITFKSGYNLDYNQDPTNPPGASTLYSSAASTTFSVTTTSVPEPASLSLLGAAAVGGLARRRRSGNDVG